MVEGGHHWHLIFVSCEGELYETPSNSHSLGNLTTPSQSTFNNTSHESTLKSQPVTAINGILSITTNSISTFENLKLSKCIFISFGELRRLFKEMDRASTHPCCFTLSDMRKIMSYFEIIKEYSLLAILLLFGCQEWSRQLRKQMQELAIQCFQCHNKRSNILISVKVQHHVFKKERSKHF